MNKARLAIFGAVLSVAALTLALVRPTEPTLSQKLNEHIATPVCLTVEGTIAKNSGIEFYDMGWPVDGPGHLGLSPHRLLDHQASIALFRHVQDLDYDLVMGQLSSVGPLYFFFKDGCVVKLVQLVGDGEEA